MLLSTLSLAAFASPPIGSPTAKFVALYANHDRATCEAGAGNANYAIYYNASEGLCFPTPGNKDSKLFTLLGESASMTGLQLQVTSTGVKLITCTGGAHGPCTTCSAWRETATPFGECELEHRFSVDMIDWLPSPSPGRVLHRMCYGQKSVLACPELYVMEDTVCETRCQHRMHLCHDHRLQCGSDKVHRPSSEELHQYLSTNGTCSGAPTRSASATYTAAGVTMDGSAFQTMWCGEQCATWKTLRGHFPLCDAPDAKTKYAVDLDAVLGGKCTNGHMSFGRWVDPTPPGECCYAALGFGHPSSPFGTPCSEVCHSFGRVGHDDEWCQISSHENYGNCFCGPERWSGA